jgi:pimeloyl-ACP methyl ester carboxylesterase
VIDDVSWDFRRSAPVDDFRLRYVRRGSGPSVVLLHGWPGCWWDQHRVLERLEGEFQVVVPDLRGFGGSDRHDVDPRTFYSADAQASSVLGLLDELGIERTRYVGHDWGAYVGLLASLRHPERIEQFVCCSLPHPWQEDRSLAKLLSAGWYQLILAAPVVGKLTIGTLGLPRLMLQRGRATGAYTDAELDTYTDVIKEPDATEASMRMYRHFLLHELLPGMSAFKDERLSVPTRWIVGEQDMVAGFADDHYKEHTDDATLEKVPGVAHFLPEEVPDLLRERVLEFF